MTPGATYGEKAAAVWGLHDDGRPISEISRITGIRKSTVKAIIMDAWREGVSGWKQRNGIVRARPDISDEDLDLQDWIFESGEEGQWA